MPRNVNGALGNLFGPGKRWGGNSGDNPQKSSSGPVGERERKRKSWEGEVTKIIKVHHAPVGDAEVKAIADYLAKTY